jgi:hypothetical protein
MSGLECSVIEPQDRRSYLLGARRKQIGKRAPDEQLDERGLRRIRGSRADYGAVAHHRHAVRDARHFLKPVRDINDPDAAFG